jgi:hypothetical protein
MSEPLLEILIDADTRCNTVQNRGWGDHISARRTAFGASLTDCWIDPVGNALLLQPLQLLPGFRAGTVTVPRLRLTDWNVATGAFEEVVDNSVYASDYYLLSDGTIDAEIQTTTIYEVNRAFYASFHVFAHHSDPCLFARFYFGQYRLDLYSDGHSCLWLAAGGACKGRGYITPGPQDLTGRMLDLVVLPYNRNQILIWSPAGGSGWVFIDASLPAQKRELDDYHITDAGQLKAIFPAGAGRFQAMPLKFKTSATYLSGVVECAIAPTSEQEPTAESIWDVPRGIGGGCISWVKEEDGITDFSPDGEKRRYRARFDLLSNGDWTPFIYGMTVDWPAVKGIKTPEQLGIVADCKSFSLHIAEDARQSQATFTVRNAGTTQYAKLRRKSGRSCIIRIGTTEIFWGVLNVPDFTLGLDENLSEYQVTAQSVLRWWELANLPNSVPWDNKPHTDFMRWLATLDDCVDSDLSWPAIAGQALPAPTEPGGDPLWQPKDGDTREEWAKKLTDLTGFVLDDAPNAGTGLMQLRYQNRDDLPTSSPQDFYFTRLESPSDRRLWVRSFKEMVEEPEATQVWAIGCREDTEELIAAAYIDFKAEDGSLADDDRPANWMGRPIPVKLSDFTLRTMDDLKKLAYRVAKRITVPRICAEIEAEYVVGLYRYSPVRVDMAVYRILEMDIDCQMEIDGATFRPTRYKLEQIA